MVLEALGWGKEPREDVSFVLESRLNFTQPMDVNWRNLFSIKMSPISAQLVTLGQNTLAPTLHNLPRDLDTCPGFARETGCREAALILLKEKGGRYNVVREPLLLDRCVICWDRDWDDCFEVTEFTTKESYIFKVWNVVSLTGSHKNTVYQHKYCNLLEIWVVTLGTRFVSAPAPHKHSYGAQSGAGKLDNKISLFCC